MTTALQVITRAMKIAGVIGQNETPTSSEADDGLVSLNDMLALWSIDRTTMFTITQSNFALVNGTASYTIGTGGNFNIARPSTIDYAFIRINSVDYPLTKINNQDYDSIAYKAAAGFPQFFYYDKAFPLAIITLYGVPTQGTLYIDTWTPLTSFTNLATDLTFPNGYATAIAYNLAIFIAPEYGVSLTQEAIKTATDSLALVKDRNLPDYVMKNEVAYLTGDYAYSSQRGY